MTTYATLAKSFNVGFRPEIQLDQIVATRAKKKCCWNNKELANEISASKKALEWVKVNDTSAAGDAHIRTLFKDVSGRSRYYKSITSGFWAWLCALFRSKTTNRQLKDLAATLSSLQRVIADSPFFKKSIFKEVRDHSSNADIFERLKKEFPNLVINHEASVKDFGLCANQSKPCVPFLIRKVKRNHKPLHADGHKQTNFDVTFPPLPPFSKAQQIETIHIPALTNLPEAFATLIERNFTPFCIQSSCPETELEFNPATQQPPADKVNLTLEKDPINGKCALVAKFEHTQHGRQTHRLEMKIGCTYEKAKTWVDDIVNQNLQSLAEVNALLAQNPAFKVSWVQRKFTTQVSNGAHTETIWSGNLSTDSFMKAKACKDNYISNYSYYNSLSDQGRGKVLEVSSGVFIKVKSSIIFGIFGRSLRGLSKELERYRYMLCTKNLEQVIKKRLNKHCPFWETCRALNPNFKTFKALKQFIESKAKDLKNDVSKSLELTRERAQGWITKDNQQFIKIKYWHPQLRQIITRKLKITPATQAADVESFIDRVENHSSKLIADIVTKERDKGQLKDQPALVQNTDKSEQGPYVTVKIGTKELKIPQKTLELRSELFKSSIHNTNKKVIDLSVGYEIIKESVHCSEEAIQLFFDFLQNGKVEFNKTTENNLFGLYSLSASYNVPELQNQAQAYFLENLNENNLAAVYSFAVYADLQELKNACFRTLYFDEAIRSKLHSQINESEHKDLLADLLAEFQQWEQDGLEYIFKVDLDHGLDQEKLSTIKEEFQRYSFVKIVGKNSKEEQIQKLSSIISTPYTINFCGLPIFPQAWQNSARIINFKPKMPLNLTRFDENEIIRRLRERNLFESINAPNATKINVRGCNLTSISAPNAIEANIEGCESLISLDTPNAIKISASNCRRIASINAPNAVEVNIEDCESLTSVNAPNAVKVNIRFCESLTSVNASNAGEIYVFPSLTSLNAPNAKEIKDSGCRSLKK